MGKKKETYVQEKMVNWYEPRMLLNIAMKALISGTFASYADRREVEAALDDNLEEDWKELTNAYCGEGGANPDIWIDVVNDTGDGFNATFAIARCVSKKSLLLKDPSGEEVETQRGKILVFGGDEVYPFPTMEEYTNRFKIPFASAVDDHAELSQEHDRPHMYAIPGNHDWYDGLGNFIKLFCQGRWIGPWTTKQHRSYFVLPLPNNYWLWATDVQLNSDIDGPQLKYFEHVGKNHMKRGDKVILVTAEPAWVFNEIKEEDKSFSKLEFFVENYIRCDSKERPFAFKLAATLTGDLHHYSRYEEPGKPNGHQYITAGGGGAFLHETHTLPEKLKGIRERNAQKKVERPDLVCAATFPDRSDSRRLMFGNFLFPFKNLYFTTLLSLLYLLFFITLHRNIPGYFACMCDSYTGPISAVWYNTHVLQQSIFSILLTIAIFFGFYAFADTAIRHPLKARVAGILHALCQLTLIYAFMFLIGTKLFTGPSVAGTDWWLRLAEVALLCILGGFCAGLLFGIYLYVCNLFRMHTNEASSSLVCADYKNFLRIKVHKDGLTIYPVGIRKVPAGWKTVPEHGNPDIPSDRRYRFEGTDPEPFLIEKPIHIYNTQL